MDNKTLETDLPALDNLKDVIVDWPRWVGFNIQLRAWRRSGDDRMITVEIESDLAVDSDEFESLIWADKITIHVGSYVDGRIFSLARALREKLGFEGEIQANGDYLPDQIRFLRRCGITTFSNHAARDNHVNFYDAAYQPATTMLENEIDIRHLRNQDSI